MRSDYSIPVVLGVLIWLAQASFVGLWTFRALKATAR